MPRQRHEDSELQPSKESLDYQSEVRPRQDVRRLSVLAKTLPLSLVFTLIFAGVLLLVWAHYYVMADMAAGGGWEND